MYEDAHAALEGILFDGMSLMAGGFGACGIPDLCIREIRERKIGKLTVISNNCGGEFPDRPGEGFGLWGLLQDHLDPALLLDDLRIEQQEVNKVVQVAAVELAWMVVVLQPIVMTTNGMAHPILH